MMTIQALGLLGLLGVAGLILIYLLKPNYQQKVISSTFVWKLSLKYRKKRIPVSRFRNIIILICQILIITSCAFILAKPLIVKENPDILNEKILIIDGSANMQATLSGKTRFERAMEDATEFGRQAIAESGKVTIIVAGKNAGYATVQTTVLETFNSDVEQNLTADKCTYGQGDVDGAVALAQLILEENSRAEVYFYTATKYEKVRNMEVVDVSDEKEWNAAILDVEVEIIENYYVFNVEVASYNKQQPEMSVIITIEDAYVAGEDIPRTLTIDNRKANCIDNIPDLIRFDDLGVYAYKSVTVTIPDEDSFMEDNRYTIYGGTKETVKVQYASPIPNTFFGGTVSALRAGFEDRWSVVASEVNMSEHDQSAQLEGYDFYIFEHSTQEEMPTDGVVMLVNPITIPNVIRGEIEISDDTRKGEFKMREGEPHAIMSGVKADKIEATSYNPIVYSDHTYKPLMFCGDDPILLVKETESVKLVILSLNIHMSTLSMLLEFPVIMYNIFDYFMPATLTQYIYDVDDPVTLNARGSKLEVRGYEVAEEFTSFPHEFYPPRPGSYDVTQTLLSGSPITENFFVKVSRIQSDFTSIREEELNGPYVPVEPEISYVDLLIFLAAALVLLLFVEWWLQTREQS